VTVDDPILGVNENVGTLDPGQSAQVLGSLLVDAGDAPQIDNIATAISDETEPVSAEWCVPVEIPCLDIEKEANFGPCPENPAIPGNTVDYIITVTNCGNVPIHNVTVDDPILGINENVGTLDPGQSAQVLGSLLVDAGHVPQIDNIATAISDETEPVSAEWCVPVEIPCLDIEKTADFGPCPDVNPVGVGGTVTYTITLSNCGNVPLHNVILNDAKLGIANLNVGDIPVGGSVPVNGTYGPVVAGDAPQIDNTAIATSDETPEPVDASWCVPVLVGEPEGCTPGYWKNIRKHGWAWEAAGLSPDDLVGDKFDLNNPFADLTLLEALSLKGGSTFEGKVETLMRHAVAALLNTSYGLSYQYVGDLVADVNAAVASGDGDEVQALHVMLAAFNEAGCPLGNAPEEEDVPAPAPAPKRQMSGEDVLGQNNPNPFNPETWISFKLANGADVKIDIYDISGRLVRTLDLGYRPAGSYWDRSQAAYWDGSNESGEAISSGVYMYRITAGTFTAMRRMVVLK
jgi:hypothetical protein